jgi:hypothetical protein
MSLYVLSRDIVTVCLNTIAFGTGFVEFNITARYSNGLFLNSQFVFCPYVNTPSSKVTETVCRITAVSRVRYSEGILPHYSFIVV